MVTGFDADYMGGLTIRGADYKGTLTVVENTCSLDALRYDDVPPRPCLDPLLLVAYDKATTYHHATTLPCASNQRQ